MTITSPKQYSFNFNPDKQLIRQFIKNNHYTGSCPGIMHSFSLELNEVIIGACIFSRTSRNNVKIPKCDEILELSRLFIIDDTPKNTESYFISKCLKWLEKESKYHAVISYSDPTEGHLGGIYKACNFEILGQTKPNYHYLTIDGIRKHKKQVWDRAKKNNVTENQQSLNENLTKIPELPKNKFLYYLTEIEHKQPYLIYGLRDPFTDEMRYVGKSSNGLYRPKEHTKPCNLEGFTYKINWIRSLVKRNTKPIITVIEYITNPDELDSKEEMWINHFRQDGSFLTNSTDGGKGSTGRVNTEKTLKKMSDAAIARSKSPYKIPHNKKYNITINGIEHRICSKCEKEVELTQFIWQEKINTWHSHCKPCKAKDTKNYNILNPPKKLTEQEKYQSYIDRSEANSKGVKAYFDNNPEAKEKLRQQRSKAIIATNIKTGEIKEFESAMSAKGYNNSNIGNAIRKKTIYRDCTWRFK